jgi:hypothetical protein
MKLIHPQPAKGRSAYSLAEVLVAAGILMIGVSAAASLTLTMNTQEDIAWRVARGLNILETAAALYQMGMDKDAVIETIPLDAAVELSHLDDEADETISGAGTLRGVTFRVEIQSTVDAGSWSAGTWTGGSDSTVPTRIVDARAYKATIDLY